MAAAFQASSAASQFARCGSYRAEPSTASHDVAGSMGSISHELAPGQYQPPLRTTTLAIKVSIFHTFHSSSFTVLTIFVHHHLYHSCFCSSQ
jgi:hypothetical protein